jgi:[ribosomal protein S5]-alanine N-acetyltransferase
METDEKTQSGEPNPGESLRQMFVAFGDAFAEVFNDPELKAKAKEFGDAATVSAMHLGRRFKDDDVKARFTQAGEAAERFGRSVAEYFKTDHKE